MLLVFCVVIGMFLVVLGVLLWCVLVFGMLGIWMVFGLVVVFNYLIDECIDKLMVCIVCCLFVIGVFSVC